MSTFDIFPFEVLQKIACQLNKKDKLSSLVACSALYPAMLESLYKNVVISDMVSFRYFLSSIAHHRHQPNFSVRTLSLLMNNNDIEYGTRIMTLTEFELLARYCANLVELFFYENEYWKLMNELDFTMSWPRLNKIPASQGTTESFQVYSKLKNQLVDISLCGIFEPKHNIMELVSPSERVQQFMIDDRRISLRVNNIRQVHACYTQLRSLVLCTKLVGPVDDGDLAILPLKSLESLRCTIDHPNSNWFSLLKLWYKDIKFLYLHCITEYRDRPIKSINMVESILDVLHTTNIQQLQFSFVNVQQYVLLAESIMMETTYDFIMMNIPTAISLNFRYTDMDLRNRQSNKLQCTLSKYQPLQVFNMHYSLENHREQYNEVRFLSELIKTPVNNQLCHLNLTRIVTLYADPITEEPTRPLHINSILDHFPNLRSLTFTLLIQKRNTKKLKNPTYNDSSDLAIVTLSDAKMSSLHHHFRCLKIVSTKVDRAIYHYLFRKCPKLSTLILESCLSHDDETHLALEYLCLEHDVDLIIK